MKTVIINKMPIVVPHEDQMRKSETLKKSLIVGIVVIFIVVFVIVIYFTSIMVAESNEHNKDRRTLNDLIIVKGVPNPHITGQIKLTHLGSLAIYYFDLSDSASRADTDIEDDHANIYYDNITKQLIITVNSVLHFKLSSKSDIWNISYVYDGVNINYNIQILSYDSKLTFKNFTDDEIEIQKYQVEY